MLLLSNFLTSAIIQVPLAEDLLTSWKSTQKHEEELPTLSSIHNTLTSPWWSMMIISITPSTTSSLRIHKSRLPESYQQYITATTSPSSPFSPSTVALGTWWLMTVSARPKLLPSRPAVPDEAPGAPERQSFDSWEFVWGWNVPGERGGKMIYILRLWNYSRWWNPMKS